MHRSKRLLALSLFALVVGALLFVAPRGGGGEVVPRSLRLPECSHVEAPAASTPEARIDAESHAQRVERSAPAPVEEHAPVDAPALAERGAFLRVVDSAGAPTAGFALIAAFATRRADGVEALSYGKHELATDERGEVDLAALLHALATLPEREKQDVLVVLGAREELTPSVLARSALGATRESATVVVRTPRALAPLRGLAVDAGTGVPLADYPLRIVSWLDNRAPVASPGLALAKPETLRLHHRIGPRRGEWLTTDAAGRFESRTALPASLVHFFTYEKVQLEAEHRIDEHGRGDEVRLEIETGPIVLLDFDPPAGYARTDFIAALRRDGNEHPAHIDELPWPGDANAGERGNSGNAGPVQDGPPPWVRLPLKEVDDEELPGFLVLESRDRRCYGSAPFDGFERHTTDPLRVELATREVLELRVEWPPDDVQGRPLDQLHVTLTPAGAGPEVEPAVSEWVWRWSREPVTSTRLLGFEPGRHRLVAGAESWAFDAVAAVPFERELELPRAEPLVLAPRLAPPIATHDVVLVVRTASGTPLDGADGRATLSDFYVSPRGDGGPIAWSGGVGRVVLRNVPEGRVQLQAHWSRGWFPLEPADATFDVPGESPELIVRDLTAEELVVRVIEPEVDGRVTIVLGSQGQGTYANPRFGLDDVVELPDGRRAYVLSSGPYLAGTEVALVELSMEGHERVWLTDSELPPPDAEGRRIVELNPRRGWSARVQVVTALDDGVAPSEPAPALVLAFDGVEAPPSDDEGLLFHRASAEPQRVVLVTPGWQLVPRSSYSGRGTVHAGGRVTFEDGELTILVRRAP